MVSGSVVGWNDFIRYFVSTSMFLDLRLAGTIIYNVYYPLWCFFGREHCNFSLIFGVFQVEKSRTISIQRAQFCSDCKAGYAQVLEQTNSHQRDYYNKNLPQVFQVYQ